MEENLLVPHPTTVSNFETSNILVVVDGLLVGPTMFALPLQHKVDELSSVSPTLRKNR